MVTCWSENADLRPSSSQLVEICSAPEFTHLLDVAIIQNDEINIDKNLKNSFKSVVGVFFQGNFIDFFLKYIL